MSKAQTDIRATSYDVNQANAVGYQGTIEDAQEQIRAERYFPWTSRARAELLHYLGVDKIQSAGPSVEMDENPRYGVEPSDAPPFHSLAYALTSFPDSFLSHHAKRMAALSESQLLMYRAYRAEFSVSESMDKAEAYPYPVKLG